MTDTSTITVDGNSPLLYEKGMVVAHSSDESGIPDCGISVGLGGGQMLYAGELPMPFSTGIKIYTRDTSILVANDVDYDVARIMIEVIATALEPQTPAQAAREPTRDDGTPDVGPPVFVMYTNYRGETARREISPVGIWFGSTDWHPKNGWLLHCYDWGKKDWRDYELLSCDFRAIAGGE